MEMAHNRYQPHRTYTSHINYKYSDQNNTGKTSFDNPDYYDPEHDFRR